VEEGGEAATETTTGAPAAVETAGVEADTAMAEGTQTAGEEEVEGVEAEDTADTMQATMKEDEEAVAAGAAAAAAADTTTRVTIRTSTRVAARKAPAAGATGEAEVRRSGTQAAAAACLPPQVCHEAAVTACPVLPSSSSPSVLWCRWRRAGTR
jgi:hypothetical protein